MDFKQLKKASSLGTLTEKLIKSAESQNTSQKDNRIFTVEREKSGNGYAVIRFMPAPSGEDEPFVKRYNHGFKANNKWYIENCPTTIGEVCPACEANSTLYNSGIEANKKIVTQRKRKLSYYSNVYIIKNPANPDLEGKVMIFRYGQKIYDKIKSALKPEFEDDSPLDPFDLWSGANFKIKVKTIKEGSGKSGKSYPNYDDSSFESPSAFLNGDDEKLEALWKQCYPLQEFVAKSQFKSYEELSKKLNRVLNSSVDAVPQQEQELSEVVKVVNDEDIMKELEVHYKTRNNQDDSEEDEALKAFRELEEMDD